MHAVEATVSQESRWRSGGESVDQEFQGDVRRFACHQRRDHATAEHAAGESCDTPLARGRWIDHPGDALVQCAAFDRQREFGCPGVTVRRRVYLQPPQLDQKVRDGQMVSAADCGKAVGLMLQYEPQRACEL